MSSRAERNDKFLLEYYKALWENIKSKETRVWAFLSVYGAAVGLVVAGTRGDISTSAQLFALTIVTGLTVWAVLIVLDANWWMSRNLLLISRVERRFPGAVKGAVPARYYKNPTFRFNPVYASSILVLAVVFMILQGDVVWLFIGKEGVATMQELSALSVLFLVSNIAIIYCIQRHEKLVRDYFGIKEDLLNDTGDLSKEGALKELTKEELDDRNKCDARLGLLIVLAILSFIFDLIVYTTRFNPFWFILTVICQSIALVIFWRQRHRYLRPDLSSRLEESQVADSAARSTLDKVREAITAYPPRKLFGKAFWVFGGLIMAVVIVSWIDLTTDKPEVLSGLTSSKGASLVELEKDITQLEKGVGSVESNIAYAREVELQRKLIQESLSLYQSRADATKSYDELRQQIQSLKQDLVASENKMKELMQRSNRKPDASPAPTNP